MDLGNAQDAITGNKVTPQGLNSHKLVRLNDELSTEDR